MQYISTNHRTNETTFKEALTRGLAPDGGLYFPKEMPHLSEEFFKTFYKYKLHELGSLLMGHFVGDSIEGNVLQDIMKEVLNFPIPLVEIEEDIFSLELFHGPTLAFKDVGARLTARLMAHFASDRKLTILVATSGDTGSAVANGFLDIEGVDVVVLYPSGMVSEIQEKQFTTLGKNITALEIDGTFDDCQALVKKAFADIDIRQNLQISSANSISVARFLPQMIYYFHAFAQLKKTRKQIVFSVPSGNYGNLTAGLFAKQMGLPIDKFIAASNINDVVPQYLKTKTYSPRPSANTISNAMDVGNPSNFARILELYNNDWERITRDISGFSFTDKETMRIMADLYKRTSYILDPHGAVAYAGLKQFLVKHDAVGVFLETAHPAKFIDTVEKALLIKLEVPVALKATLKKKKLSIKMKNSFSDFKRFLLDIK